MTTARNGIGDLAIWLKMTFPETKIRISHTKTTSVVDFSKQNPSALSWSSRTGKFKLCREDTKNIETFSSAEEVKARLASWSF